MREDVEAVFKDISEDDRVDSRGQATDEEEDDLPRGRMLRADRSAFIEEPEEPSEEEIRERRARALKRQMVRRKEIRQVVFLLALILVLLIITGILFYTPEL